MGVAHLNGFEGPALRKFVGAMRSDPGQTIDLYFTGGHAEAKDAGREKWTRRMAPLVTALNATPNIEVKSFDLDHKPHPTAIAVRIHEGKPQLIRFSGLSSQKHPDGEREFERGDIGRAWCKQGIRTKLCQVNYLALHADNEMSEYKNSARKPFTLSYDGRRSENQDPAKAALAAPPDDTGTPGQGDNWQTSIGPRTGRKKG
ncbi:MAG: hypothetical protein EBV03_10855 [Proteobacteria bacterium]|nr:hypothetical protein [Pseudomonadota bacterium]